MLVSTFGRRKINLFLLPQPLFYLKLYMGYHYYFYAFLLLWYGYIVFVSLLAVKHLLSLSSIFLLFIYFGVINCELQLRCWQIFDEILMLVLPSPSHSVM